MVKAERKPLIHRLLGTETRATLQKPMQSLVELADATFESGNFASPARMEEVFRSVEGPTRESLDTLFPLTILRQAASISTLRLGSKPLTADAQNDLTKGKDEWNTRLVDSYPMSFSKNIHPVVASSLTAEKKPASPETTSPYTITYDYSRTIRYTGLGNVGTLLPFSLFVIPAALINKNLELAFRREVINVRYNVEGEVPVEYAMVLRNGEPEVMYKREGGDRHHTATHYFPLYHKRHPFKTFVSNLLSEADSTLISKAPRTSRRGK